MRFHPHLASPLQGEENYAYLRNLVLGGIVEWGDGCALKFSTREGKATLAKLTREYDKMSITTGIFVKPSPLMRGGIGEMVINTEARSYLNRIIEEGFEHHVCAVHSDLKAELLKFCKLAGADRSSDFLQDSNKDNKAPDAKNLAKVSRYY